MGFVDGVDQVMGLNMGVDLGCRDVCVAQKLLKAE
jgi:hypothetical protein